MIRLCPSCATERPLTETFCEGHVDDRVCGWDLSAVDISRPGAAGRPAPRIAPPMTCPNGHQMSAGDLLCGVCGAVMEEPAGDPDAAPMTPEDPSVETVIDGWRIERAVSSSSAIRELFMAVRESDGQRGVLTLYAAGSEPDADIYDALRKLPREHVPETYATGRFSEQAYEVAEEFPAGTLSDLPGTDTEGFGVREIATELGRAIHAMSEAGLRHRDLRPSAILVRSSDPLDLVVTGFGSARLSEFDLDIASPLETSRYMAPEAIAGGVAPASDWWSLGMLLLERITGGACFEGVNEQAFLIHVLTNGVPIPENLDPSHALLLRGLLARDRRQRWQWKEVRGWLGGEAVEAPEAPGKTGAAEVGTPIVLGGTQYRSPASFALAAAEAANWDLAKDLLLRGAVGTWVSEGSFEKIGAALRQLAKTSDVPDDLRLAIALKHLNPAMPFIVRGNIVTPGWLLDHPEDGYALISGPAPDLIRSVDPDDWLWRLKERAGSVRKRLEHLDIVIDEESLRIHLLSTSMARLAALWEERRRMLPDTDHAGIVSLIERRQSAPEDLVVLLSASSAQFRSAEEVIDEAEKEALSAGIYGFSREAAATELARPRREIYRDIDGRIEDFARCGVPAVDGWADQFRLDRRMPVARAVALLAIPSADWKALPRQTYVSTILDFFAKRISGGVLRGPLTRMLIGKSAARIDLTELDTPRVPAAEILAHLLSRGGRAIDIDPAAFSDDDGLERRLRSLHSHALLYKRDTGIDGLYMGFPFLVMRDGRANTKPRIAPVLLWPVRVVPETGNRGHVTLGYGRDRDKDAEAEQVVLNPALEAMVGVAEAKRWQEVADELLARAAISAADVGDAFGQLAASTGGELCPLPAKDAAVGSQERRIVPAAVFFHLAFMGQAVMKDLQLIRGLPPEATGLEIALRLAKTQPQNAAVPRVRETERFFTADSDPSQEAAIMEARHSPGLVVEGPPGTGKSQTIVNMVADAIGMGRSLLVICQKQAALDVVRKRLEKERLGDRFVIITDIARDRESIVGSIRDQVEALHARPAGGAPAWKRDRERLAGRIETLEDDLDRQHVALHAVDERTGLTYRTLLGELLALEAGASNFVDMPSLRPHLASLHSGDVAALEENCGPLARYWLPAKFEDSPLAVLKIFNPDRGVAASLSEAVQRFADIDLLREIADQETAGGLRIQDPQEFRQWLGEADDLRAIGASLSANLGRWLPLFRSSQGAGSRGTNMLSELVSIEAGLSALDASHHRSGTSETLISWPSEEVGRSATLVAAVVGTPAGLARINPMRLVYKRRLRTLMARMGIDHGTSDTTSFHRALALELGARPLRSRLAQLFMVLFDRAPDPMASPTVMATMAANLHAIVSRVHGLVSLIDRCPQRTELDEAAMAGTTEGLDGFFDRAEQSLRRHDARDESRRALEVIRTYMDEGWISARLSAIANGRSNAAPTSEVLAALPTLVNFQEFRLRSTRLGEKERTIFRLFRTKEAELGGLPPAALDGCIRATISREAHLAWKGILEASNPDVLFDADALQSKVASLADADAQIRNRNRELLIHDIDPSRVKPALQWNEITRLRGPRALRLREFIDRGAGLGLFALRPIWLMTPDVASRVLQPTAGLFDTVIFDEASQMPVEYALPSLFRSKVVVVSGDEKQMPPTAFFASKVENDEAAVFDGEDPEESADEEERETFLETWNRREIKDCPDLLQLARSVLPVTTLQVHYRSEYRELISFSNASFYANRLSVPVRHPDEVVRRLRPIEVVRSDGVYMNQTNPKEAADVVDYLAGLWEDPHPPSVGVVTFNRKQADAIEDALEERAEEDASFRDALMRERERVEGGEDVGFFVKNVENVQGDERDVVVFSTTFGRNEKGTFRRSFGALGQVGGERRLNVAVTRARKKVVIVTSMPVAEISDLLATRRAPRIPRDYLQGYLEYARTVSDGAVDTGRALLDRMVTEKSAERGTDGQEDDGFTTSVMDFMVAEGWKPAKTRDAGAFSLDFAVTDPATGLYAIGVECDAPRHKLLERARAREVWRPKVLTKSVPHIHRISSYAWAHSGKDERRRLKAAVENALAGAGGNT